MWAHYANGSKGIRIDFSIDYEKFAEVEGYVKEVEYRQKNQFNNSNDLEKELNENKLQNIICRKSEAWKYEQEHRAIFTKGDNNYLSIKIERITFGRGCGFFPNKKLNNPESEQENAWKHILKIASFIYKVMKESNKNKGVMPKFYYYQDKYSLEPVEIPKEKLDSELERVTKLQDEIQLLEQKIVDLKKEINNPTIRSKQTPTEKKGEGATSIPAVPPYLACALLFLCWPLLTNTCVPANALQRLQPNVSLHHPHSLERFTTLLHRIYYTQYCSNTEGRMSNYYFIHVKLILIR